MYYYSLQIKMGFKTKQKKSSKGYDTQQQRSGKCIFCGVCPNFSGHATVQINEPCYVG
jgi:formate hydrogenlyase subunit 6/NADH:ubiquinone oxidoreductase subunit I